MAVVTGLRLEVDVGDEEVFSKLREKFSDKKSQQDDKRARPYRERRSRRNRQKSNDFLALIHFLVIRLVANT